MQNFYRCDEGYEESASVTSHNQCIKLVKDMHYEAQVQCVINYSAMFLTQKIKNEVARNMKLTREQYLQVHLELYLYQVCYLYFTFHLLFTLSHVGACVVVP